MVTTPYGLNDPTKPPSHEPVKCIVKGCENNADPGSVTMLCMQCCHVVATGDMVWYYANYTGKNWISDTVSKIVHLQQDKRDLQEEVDELKEDIKEAYILENDDVLSLNDLRTFYHENKDLNSTLNIHNLLLFQENEALKEGHKNKDQFIDSLKKEIDALNYNIDHAYTLGDGGFLTVDDLCIFYQENKNIHNVVSQQHNRIVLLGLQLKKANETIKHQDETIQAFKKELDSMEKEFTEKEKERSEEETFVFVAKEHFKKKAEAAAEKVADNVKFDTYTEGFRKGFDMGYEKAKDQYYE
jgi:peptidoglycan hydrolase CwlO-like protein